MLWEEEKYCPEELEKVCLGFMYASKFCYQQDLSGLFAAQNHMYVQELVGSLGGNTQGHCTLSPKFSHAFFQFFHILHPFLSKCMQRMWKRRKSNLIRIFFDGRKFRRQCANVIDTTWGRIYFLTCEHFGWKFRTQCAETFTVAKLLSKMCKRWKIQRKKSFLLNLEYFLANFQLK